jgi:structural maintenance of chromosome 4
MDVAQSELDIYLSTEKKEKNVLDSMKEQLEKASQNYTERHRNLQELESNNPKWAKSLSEKQTELQKVLFFLSYNSFLFLFIFSNFNSFLSKVTNEDKTKSEELRNIRIRLEQSRSTFSANTSRGRILDGLMEQKRKGTLPGIYGRLGDLGAIDEKFDGAVSTACGPLDNIVVDTVDTAQKCIAYLKNGNLGRASFIALEKMVGD